MKVVDRSSLMHAWLLITKLESLGVVLPSLRVGLVGDVALIWKNSDYYLEITASIMGSYVTYTNTKGSASPIFLGNLESDNFDADWVEKHLSDFKAIPDTIRSQIAVLETFRSRMSYNDSYFGEPEGFVKRLARNINFWLYPQVRPTDERDPDEKGT